MKSLTYSVIITMLSISLFASAGSEQKSSGNLSPGEYSGYSELYAVKNNTYVICGGCESLGVECDLKVSQKGINIGSTFYPWTLSGFQASRAIKDGGKERITFQGRFGSVIVVDLTTERPKGDIVSLIRMTVAPSADTGKGKAKEKKGTDSLGK